MHRKLFPRRLIVVLAIVMLILIVGGLGAYLNQEQQLRQQAEEDLQTIAELKTNQIAAWRAERLSDATILTESPFFTAGVSKWLSDPQETQQTAILARLRSLQVRASYANVLLVDENGRVLLNLNEKQVAFPESTLQAMAEAFQNRRPTMTDLHEGPDDQTPHMDVIAPLFASSDPTVPPFGAVILQVDATRFLYPLIQSWPTNSASAETLIIRQDGDTVLFLNALRYAPDAALTLRIPLTQTDVPAVAAVLGQRGIYQGHDYRGVEVLSVITAIPDSPWFMIAKVDASEILDAWRSRSVGGQILIAALIISIAIAGNVVWQRNQNQHYEALFQAEKARHESEKRYRRLLDTMLEGCQIIGFDWRYLYINAAAAQHGRRSKEDLLGQTMMACYPNIKNTALFAALKRSMEDRVSQHLENEFYFENGDSVWFDLRVQPVPEGLFILSYDITERMQAAQKTAELAAIVQSSQDAILSTNLDGVIMSWNAGAETTYGYKASEVIGKSIVLLTPPDYQNEIIEILETIKRGERVARREIHRQRKDGQFITIALTASPLRDSEGQIVAASTIARDITERKRAEVALQESEARYKSLFESNHAVMMLVDTETAAIVDVNPAACAYYGWTRAELCAMRVDQINTLTPQEIASEMQRAYHQERNHFVFKHRLADGTLRDVEVYSSPIEIQGRVMLYSIVHDITQRIQFERALQESEERLRLFVEHAPASLAMFDREMRYLSVSHRWLTDYQLEGTDIIGQSHYTIFPEISNYLKAIHRRGLAGEVFSAKEEEFVRANGTTQWLSWEMRPWYTSEREVGGIVIFSEDVTDRRAAEMEIQTLNAELEQRVQQRTAELEASNRELEAFSHSVSHDLRAPLRAMDGFSRILIEDYSEELSPEAQRYLGLVRDNAQQMGSLIDHLLTFSRLGRQSLRKQEVAPIDLVREVLAGLQSEQEGRDIDMTIADLPPCQADPALLRQVFANLLGNALKFTRQRDKAVIEVGCQINGDDTPVYFVKDNGAGFDMQYANKLFGVFQRLHHTEDYEGTGVGLATVQRIIHRHGGRIWAEAKIDHGAAFYFTLGEESPNEGQ